MKILITGIHGFIGGNLVNTLKEQHTIYGLDIVSPQKDGIKHTYSWNDLKDIPLIDCIIHLAGKAHDTRKQTDAQVYFDINTGLTEKIFNWFLIGNTKKFIFFSSVKAAADQVNGDILTEDVVPAPKGPYGESKIAAESYILNHTLPADKKMYILRPCMIHGPENKGNLNLLYKLVHKGIPWPLGDFENQRSFTSVENLQFVIRQIIEKNIESGIYNMADDETLSTNRLVELIAASANRKAKIWKLDKGVINRLAKLGDTLQMPLNSERLKKLTESYVVSNQKIKDAIGIQKMPVTAEVGMQRTLNSFK